MPTTSRIAGALVLSLLTGASATAADEVDIAVEAVFIGGAIAGIPVGGLDKGIVKSLVRCAVGRPGPSLLTCSQELVVQRLPPGAQPFARCLMSGQGADGCAEDEMVRQGVPPEALQLAKCVATRPDFGECLAMPVSDAAQAAALRVVADLKADARSRVQQTAIRNLLDVVTGIRNNDWFLVFEAGGPEVYQAALQTALVGAAPYLAPASKYLQPTLRNVAEARFDQVNNVVSAARSGDAPRLAEALVTAYLASEKLICLIDEVPEELRHLACGTFSKVTSAVAGAAGDAVRACGEALRDIGGAASDVWDSTAGVRESIAGRDRSCGSPAGHYLDKYASCYHVGAYFLLNPATRDRFSEMQLNLKHECRNIFRQCYFTSNPDRVTPICRPMEETFDTQVKEMAAAISAAAARFVGTFDGFVAARFRRRDGTTDTAAACRPDALQRAEDSFRAGCVSALRAQYGPERKPIVQVCGLRVGETFDESVYDEACRGAIRRSDDTSRRVAVHRACRTQAPLSAPSNCYAIGSSCAGEATLACRSPLAADEYVVQATRLTADGSVDQAGGVIQQKARWERGALWVSLAPGDYSLQVCASQGAASECGNPFTLKIFKCSEPSGPYHPPARRCPEGENPCWNGGCAKLCPQPPQ